MAVGEQFKGSGEHDAALLKWGADRNYVMFERRRDKIDADTAANPAPARRSIATRRRGSTIVQVALVLPVSLLLLFGILEYCRYVMLLQVVTNAAREGCRYAVMHTDAVVLNGTTYGNSTANVTSVITNVMGGVSLANQSIQIYSSDASGNNLGTWANTTNGQWICVRITGNFYSVISKFLYMPTSLPISAEVVMQCEAN